MADVPSILPPSSTPLERNLEQATARLGEIAFPNATLWNAATCPEELLPYLAWALQLETWNSNWPLTVKRAVIAAAPAAKRLKGTVGSVRRALAALGAKIDVTEWFQNGGAPYTADVRVYAQDANGSPQLSPEFLAEMQATLASYAPARARITALFGVAFNPINIAGAITRSLTRLQTRATTYAGPVAPLQVGCAATRPVEVMRVQAFAELPLAAGQLAGFDPGNIGLAVL